MTAATQRTSRLTILMILLSSCSMMASSSSRRNLEEEVNLTSSWYTRYPVYPEYCSTPEEMNQRSIPPLSSNVTDTRLVHVTSVIRHGARTPYSSRINCWNGFWESTVTGIWNCNLTTTLGHPGGGSLDETNGMVLLSKQYNGLQLPLKNELNGTCQVGQLLLRGHEQELRNGQHLRTAYTYEGTTDDRDVRMRLIDLSNSEDSLFSQLKYRSDDDQRTLMSGQVLLRGLFGDDQQERVVIPLHTADRNVDILDSNEDVCPRLTELRQEAESSQEYKDFAQSTEIKTLETFMKTELGQVMDDPIDCIMCTMCTDRPLPRALDDYGRNSSSTKYHQQYGPDLLRRLVESDTKRWAIPQTYNDGVYAKLSMAPLWNEILVNIRPVLDDKPHHKLALFSGHDTTIQPLLISLGIWDGQWAPYATMLIIEIHELIEKSDYAFRLLLNGRVLTSKMDGCPQDSDLCDMQILLNHVTSFATNYDCTPQLTHVSRLALEESMVLLSTSGGVALVLSVVLLSSLLGSLVTYSILTRRLPCSHRLRQKRRLHTTINGDMTAVPVALNGDDEDDEVAPVERLQLT